MRHEMRYGNQRVSESLLCKTQERTEILTLNPSKWRLKPQNPLVHFFGGICKNPHINSKGTLDFYQGLATEMRMKRKRRHTLLAVKGSAQEVMWMPGVL